LRRELRDGNRLRGGNVNGGICHGSGPKRLGAIWLSNCIAANITADFLGVDVPHGTPMPAEILANAQEGPVGVCNDTEVGRRLLFPAEAVSPEHLFLSQAESRRLPNRVYDSFQP
jgi:hypothetical protein